MEAMGVAASVAGLVSLAIEIPKLINTIASMHAAPEEAKQLSNTVDALAATLRRLEAFLKSDETKDIMMAEQSALTVSIAACQGKILALSRKLRSFSSPPSQTFPKAAATKIGNVIARVRWPINKTECLEVIAELHAMQSTFEFCLVIKNCEQMSKSHKEAIAHFKAQKDMLTQMSQTFPDQASNTQTMLDRLEVVETCVSTSLQQLNSIHEGVEELREMKKDLSEYYAEELHGQALEWLSPLDASAKHYELHTCRQPGTCDWIVTDPALQQWVQSPPDGDASVTCWTADPGQGKTFTMSRIIDYLHDTFPQGTGTCVTYLYCDYQRTRSDSATDLMGAIIRQLLAQFDQLPQQIGKLIRHAKMKLRQPRAREENMRNILELLKPHVQRLFICIDALDEAESAEALLSLCRRIPLPTSLLFVGRQSIAHMVTREFPTAVVQIMKPQLDDIDAFVTAYAHKDRVRRPNLMPEDLIEMMRAEISKLANGMFLLAALHTRLVLSHTTVHRRREALNDLPHTIDGAFDRTIERIREHAQAEQALKILAWTHYVGPLTMFELQHVLAIEANHTKFKHDNMPHYDTLLDCCLGLVKLGSPHYDAFYNKASLAHLTLSAYLESHPAVLQDALADIVEACLAYLSFHPKDQLGHLNLLIRDSWLLLFCILDTPSQRLLDSTWAYCLLVHGYLVKKSLGEETHGKISMHTLPENAVRLASRKVPDQHVFHRQGIHQSIFHTVCMLGLDCLDSFLEPLLRHLPSTEDLASAMCALDYFGMTPLGWTLVSKNHFKDYSRTRARVTSMDSFDTNLWRAARLLRIFPSARPSQQIWDIAALETLRKSGSTSLNSQPIRYSTRVLLLFFLGNYFTCPEAISCCVRRMSSHLNPDSWVNLPRLLRHTNTSVPLHQLYQSWSLVFVESTELNQLGRVGTTEVATPELPAKRESTDTPWPGDTTVTTNNSSGTPKWPKLVISALFMPGASSPSLVCNDLMRVELVAYTRSRPDMYKESSDPFEWVNCDHILLPRQALVHAGAVSGSMDIVRQALTEFVVNPNLQDHNGQTALHLAIRHEVIALFLIEQSGINVGIRDSRGLTALHLCVKQHLVTHATAILEKQNANINAQDNLGNTALHYAVSAASRVMTTLLLKAHADVNLKNNQGQTPLHLAIQAREVLICEVLLDHRHGTTFDIKTIEDAWEMAIKAGAGFIVALLRGLRVMSQPLLTAAISELSVERSGRGARVLQMLPVAGFLSDITEADLDFMLKLDDGIKSSSSSVITSSSVSCVPMRSGSAALVHFADAVNIRGALTKGAGTAAACLLSLSSPGAIDLNHLGEDGESALHLAVIYNAEQAVRVLLARDDINCNLTDPHGYTALHLSLNYKRLEILRMLLGSPKVDASRTHVNGATALHLAIHQRFSDAIPLLVVSPAVLVNQVDDSGRAPLHYAAMQQDIGMVKMLLECPRIVPEMLSGDGRTALAYAALSSGPDVVAALLDTGKFDVAHRDSYGKSALDWASFNANKEVAQILRDATLAKESFGWGQHNSMHVN